MKAYRGFCFYIGKRLKMNRFFMVHLGEHSSHPSNQLKVCRVMKGTRRLHLSQKRPGASISAGSVSNFSVQGTGLSLWFAHLCIKYYNPHIYYTEICSVCLLTASQPTGPKRSGTTPRVDRKRVETARCALGAFWVGKLRADSRAAVVEIDGAVHSWWMDGWL